MSNPATIAVLIGIATVAAMFAVFRFAQQQHEPAPIVWPLSPGWKP